MEKRIKVKDLLKCEAGQKVTAKGWVRTKRGNKNVAFILPEFTCWEYKISFFYCRRSKT